MQLKRNVIRRQKRDKQQLDGFREADAAAAVFSTVLERKYVHVSTYVSFNKIPLFCPIATPTRIAR